MLEFCTCPHSLGHTGRWMAFTDSLGHLLTAPTSKSSSLLPSWLTQLNWTLKIYCHALVLFSQLAHQPLEGRRPSPTVLGEGVCFLGTQPILAGYLEPSRPCSRTGTHMCIGLLVPMCLYDIYVWYIHRVQVTICVKMAHILVPCSYIM